MSKSTLTHDHLGGSGGIPPEIVFDSRSSEMGSSAI